MTFSISKFLAGISVLDTRYVYPRSQNNYPFYFFNDQLDYIFTDLFTELETTKSNVDKYCITPLIKLITKKLLY